MRKLRWAMSAGRAKGLIGLTFDDGSRDFLHVAVPMLERFGFSATVFVVAGMIGGENSWEHAYNNPKPQLKLLTADELREVTKRGMEVGAHGMTHVNLSHASSALLKQEVHHSRRILGEVLGEEAEGFAYPYGSVDKAAIQSVRNAGYAYACANRLRIEHSDYDLVRAPMSGRDCSLRLRTKLMIYPEYASVVSAFEKVGHLRQFVVSGHRGRGLYRKHWLKQRFLLPG